MTVTKLALTLTLTLWLSGPTAETSPTAEDAYRQIFSRLEKMSFDEQQAWLRQLEDRARKTAEATLPPEEASRWKAHLHSLLHRKLITWQVLRQAIELTEARERAALELLRQEQADKGKKPEPATVQKRKPEKTVELVTPGEQTQEDDRSAAEEVLQSQSWLRDRLAAMAEKVHTDLVSPVKEETAGAPSPKKNSFSRLENFLKSLTILPDEPLPLPRSIKQKLLSRAVPREPVENAEHGEEKIERPVPVEVNVEELAARIAGCNMAFRLLEGELGESGEWRAARLEPLLDRLSVLLIRHSDLELFRDLVPEEERHTLAKLASPKPVLEQFRTRLAEARRAAEALSDDQPERRNELSRLEAVARRFAEISEKKEDRQ